MSIGLHIFTIVFGFFMLLFAAFVQQAGFISTGLWALISALWFISFNAQAMLIARHLYPLEDDS